MSLRGEARNGSRSCSRASERQPLLGGTTHGQIPVQEPIDGAHLHAGDAGGMS